MSIHEEYETFIPGTPGQTNWPQLPPAKKRPDRTEYFVDVDGITEGSAKTLPLARKLAKLLGGTVRLHTFTEENREQRLSERRRRYQLGNFTSTW